MTSLPIKIRFTEDREAWVIDPEDMLPKYAGNVVINRVAESINQLIDYLGEREEASKEEYKKVCGNLHYHSFWEYSDKCMGCGKTLDECNRIDKLNQAQKKFNKISTDDIKKELEGLPKYFKAGCKQSDSVVIEKDGGIRYLWDGENITKLLQSQQEQRDGEKFTKTEVEQLQSYCEARDRESWYYGPKTQFEKRHSNIVKKLSSLLKESKVRTK